MWETFSPGLNTSKLCVLERVLTCTMVPSSSHAAAVMAQDCEQYTVCRDCITLPQCTWCSDNTVSPAGLGKDRCCCGFLMYIDNEYNPLIGPNLAEYFLWYPAGWFPSQL